MENCALGSLSIYGYETGCRILGLGGPAAQPLVAAGPGCNQCGILETALADWP